MKPLEFEYVIERGSKVIDSINHKDQVKMTMGYLRLLVKNLNSKYNEKERDDTFGILVDRLNWHLDKHVPKAFGDVFI